MISALSLLGAILTVAGLASARRARVPLHVVLAMLGLMFFACLNDSQWSQSVHLNILRISLSVVLILMVCTSFLRQRSHDGALSARFPVAVHWLIALAVYEDVVNSLMATDVSTYQVLGRLLALVAWVAVAVLVASNHSAMQALASSVVITFGASLALSRLSPNPWTSCSDFKCSSIGQLFVGIFQSENSMARLACLAAVLCLALGWRMSALTIPTAALVLIVTESRTSQIALILALLVVASATKAPQLVRRGLVIATPVVLSLGIWLVYTATPSEFSNRGYIWTLGRTAIASHWVFGSGIDNWVHHVLSRNYMHSEALYLLYAGGVVALGLYAVFVWAGLTGIKGAGSHVRLGVFALLLVTGLLEVVANPVALDGATLYLVALIVCAASPNYFERTAGRPMRGPADTSRPKVARSA